MNNEWYGEWIELQPHRMSYQAGYRWTRKKFRGGIHVGWDFKK